MQLQQGEADIPAAGMADQSVSSERKASKRPHLVTFPMDNSSDQKFGSPSRKIMRAVGQSPGQQGQDPFLPSASLAADASNLESTSHAHQEDFIFSNTTNEFAQDGHPNSHYLNQEAGCSTQPLMVENERALADALEDIREDFERTDTGLVEDLAQYLGTTSEFEADDCDIDISELFQLVEEG